MGPERVYTIEASDPEKKEGCHDDGVYFFLPYSFNLTDKRTENPFHEEPSGPKTWNCSSRSMHEP